MMKKRRSNAIKILVLVCTLVLCVGILQPQAVTLQQPTTQTTYFTSPPTISNWYVNILTASGQPSSEKSRAPIGTEIIIEGRDFQTASLKVWLGGQELTIITKAVNQIKVILPSRTVVGPLVAGYGAYGTVATQSTLASSFTAYGTPVITNVTPSTFRYGDTVTIQGQNLFQWQSFPTCTSSGGVTYFYFKIPDPAVNPQATYFPASISGNDFVGATAPKFSPDGTNIVFVAGLTYSLSNCQGSFYTPNTPQPQSLKGNLRLYKPVGEMGNISPSPVTYMGGYGPMTISEVTSGLWKAPFVLLVRDGQRPQAPLTSLDPLTGGVSLPNEVSIIGTNLLGQLSGSIGNISLSSIGARSYGALATIPYSAYSNRITVNRATDGATATSPQLTVALWPEILNYNFPYQGLKFTLNTEVTITGSNLLPSAAIPGLNYLVRPMNLPPGINFTLVAHTATYIKMKFTGTTTALCSDPTGTSQTYTSAASNYMPNYISLIGKYTPPFTVKSTAPVGIVEQPLANIFFCLKQ